MLLPNFQLVFVSSGVTPTAPVDVMLRVQVASNVRSSTKDTADKAKDTAGKAQDKVTGVSSAWVVWERFRGSSGCGSLA